MNQKVSYLTSLVIFTIILFLTLTTILTSVGVMDILLLIYFYSYVKLFISCVKYIPQVWMNYRRKSTEGWSIGNILLDFTGGIFSFVQMVLLAINYNDWVSIFGSVTKLGLALLSMGFDLIFMLQHYKFYRTRRRSSNRGYRILDDHDSETNNTAQSWISFLIQSWMCLRGPFYFFIEIFTGIELIPWNWNV